MYTASLDLVPFLIPIYILIEYVSLFDILTNAISICVINKTFMADTGIVSYSVGAVTAVRAGDVTVFTLIDI